MLLVFISDWVSLLNSLNYCSGKYIKEKKTGKKDKHTKIVAEFVWLGDKL